MIKLFSKVYNLLTNKLRTMLVKHRYNNLKNQANEFLEEHLRNLKKIEGEEHKYVDIYWLHGYFDETAKVADGRLAFHIMGFEFYTEAVIYPNNDNAILLTTYEIVKDTDRLSRLHKEYGYPENKIKVDTLSISLTKGGFNLMNFQNESLNGDFFPFAFWEWCKRLIKYIDSIKPE